MQIIPVTAKNRRGGCHMLRTGRKSAELYAVRLESQGWTTKTGHRTTRRDEIITFNAVNRNRRVADLMNGGGCAFKRLAMNAAVVATADDNDDGDGDGTYESHRQYHVPEVFLPFYND